MVNVDNRELTNKKRLAYYMRAAFMSYELSLFTFFIHLSARLLLSRSTCFIKQLDLAINDACHAYAFIYGVVDTTYRGQEPGYPTYIKVPHKYIELEILYCNTLEG